ncbi:MAG: amylo-alpha-1,6-glucosidase [Elainellaceae cyanobacterium]
MTIRFGRATCGQLDAAASREWLVTNGIGGYACGTVAGHLTRAYHGLLIAALDPPVGRSLLLAKLDETVTYRGKDYPLYTNQWGANRWQESTIVPHGYRHIEHFELEGTVPVWTFAMGDARLQKRVCMVQGENTTGVRYSLTRGAGLDLTLKIIVNHRDHHGGSHPGDWRVTAVENGIRVQVSDDSPFYVLASQDNPHIVPQIDLQVDPQWLCNFGLAVEHYRGTGDRDAHLQAAVLNVHLEPQQSLTIVASTEAAYLERPLDSAVLLSDRQKQDEALVACWHHSISENVTPPDWLAPLILAADTFIVDRPTRDPSGKIPGKTVIAGYPWFGDWGRDTMISLPGLTLAAGRPELARPILRTFGQHLSQGMLPNLFPDSGQAPEYNTVDAVLWYFEAVRSYYDATQDRDLLNELFPALAGAILWHQRGTRYGIRVDPEDGLLYAGEPGVQLTWMDAKVNDWVVTPRTGKPIEVNALWYNALRVMAYFAHLLGQPDRDYRQMARRCRQGFQLFWSAEKDYCFDVIDTPSGTDAALRPNQIFAVALPYESHLPGEALLAPEQQKAIVDAVSANLLTSYGLRSLAPSHPDYVGTYGGDRLRRDGAYHQGTVWGWLMGPFVQAHWNVYRDAEQALSFLEPCADHLSDAGLGSVSEIFDGDAPHTPRGCFAQAWSVAEILRVRRMLSEDI